MKIVKESIAWVSSRMIIYTLEPSVEHGETYDRDCIMLHRVLENSIHPIYDLCKMLSDMNTVALHFHSADPYISTEGGIIEFSSPICNIKTEDSGGLGDIGHVQLEDLINIVEDILRFARNNPFKKK